MIETTPLYGGEILLEFNSANHQYRVINKGRRYKVPSVTTITSVLDKSGPLVNWAINNTLEVCKGAIAPGTEYAEVYLEQVWDAAKKASQRIKSEAAEKGTNIHAVIESGLNSGQRLSEILPVANTKHPELANFVSFAVERKVYSRRHRYSGTLDALGTIEGKTYLLDWKTSKSVYPEFRLQTAAYQYAWEEEHPDQPIEGRYIIQIVESGEVIPHYYPRSTYRLDFKGFTGALALYNQVKKINKNPL